MLDVFVMMILLFPNRFGWYCLSGLAAIFVIWIIYLSISALLEGRIFLKGSATARATEAFIAYGAYRTLKLRKIREYYDFDS